MNAKPTTFALLDFTSSAAANAVPPVANKSSCIKTFQFGLISSA